MINIDKYSDNSKSRKALVNIRINVDIKNMSCGVPQRSIIGPFVYLLCVTDIPNSTCGQIC